MKVKIAPDFRDLFRPLTTEELEQAKANNLADPDHERIPPVVVWQCGTDCIIVDGHHTHAVRDKLRVNGKPVKIRYHKADFPDRQSAIAYAIRAQIGRRNLSPSQVAIALAKLPKAQPGRDGKGSQLATNGLTGGTATEGKGSQLATNSQPSREELAQEAGVGRRTMQRADKVHEHGAKAVKDAVTSGDVTVSDAASVANLPKSEQAAALKAKKAGNAKTLSQAAKPPKQFPRSHWFKQWEQAIGPLVRLVDKIANEIGEKHDPHHVAVQERLNEATEEMEKWLGK